MKTKINKKVGNSNKTVVLPKLLAMLICLSISVFFWVKIMLL